MKYPFVKINILQYLVSNGELTGYSFIKYCENNGISVSNGTIYPHLKELENAGLIESTVDGKRKVYQLTDSGENWVKNSTNASMPSVLSHSFVRLYRSIDLVKWEDAEDVKKLAAMLEQTKRTLDEYVITLGRDKTKEGEL